MFSERPFYAVTVSVDDGERFEVIEQKQIGDPFIVTTISANGWRTAWKVARHGLKYVVRVQGDEETIARVLALDPEHEKANAAKAEAG